MVATGSADVAQYFGFAINMAQKIAYLFGEDDLFNENNNLSDEATVKIIGYLGAMFGVSGATSIIAKTSTIAGKIVHSGRRNYLKLSSYHVYQKLFYRILQNIQVLQC